jgi:hypothetical protein
MPAVGCRSGIRLLRMERAPLLRCSTYRLLLLSFVPLRRRGREDRATESPHNGAHFGRCSGCALFQGSRAVDGRTVVVVDDKLQGLHPRSVGGCARRGLHFLVGEC